MGEEESLELNEISGTQLCATEWREMEKYRSTDLEYGNGIWESVFLKNLLPPLWTFFKF